MKTKHQVIAQEIGDVVAEKNAAYGDAFNRAGEVMRVLYPNGIAPEQMVDALGVVRVVDKLFRLANQKDAFGESPWRDIAGYGVLGATRDEPGFAFAPVEPDIVEVPLEHAKQVSRELRREISRRERTEGPGVTKARR